MVISTGVNMHHAESEKNSFFMYFFIFLFFEKYVGLVGYPLARYPLAQTCITRKVKKTLFLFYFFIFLLFDKYVGSVGLPQSKINKLGLT